MKAAGPWTRERIAEVLNRMPLVRWDRCTGGDIEGGHRLITTYGWIDRPDGRSDFVVIEFPSWPSRLGLLTSSAEHEAALHLAVYGPDDDDPHHPCIRIEDAFGELVTNHIVLGP